MTGDGPKRWELKMTPSGLRLAADVSAPDRGFGRDSFTWADLLYATLAEAAVYVVYFPTRFNREVDEQCTRLLRAFGDNTSRRTSVNFWDPQDEYLEEALALFGVTSLPTIVLATGVQLEAGTIDDSNLYCIRFTNTAVMENEDAITNAINLAHNVLIRGNAREIASLVRRQDRQTILRVVARAAGATLEQVAKLKLTIGLPGGISVGLG